MPDEKPDNVDRMEFKFPFGGGFSVSGRNASKLFWAVGVTAIIIALGWSIANIVGAFHGDQTTVPVVPGGIMRVVDPPDLPRWSRPKHQKARLALQDAVGSDRHNSVLCGIAWG